MVTVATNINGKKYCQGHTVIMVTRVFLFNRRKNLFQGRNNNMIFFRLKVLKISENEQ